MSSSWKLSIIFRLPQRRSSDAAQQKLQWAASASAVLDRFADVEIRTMLGDLDVHNPINTMMASFNSHGAFDKLQMWLTPARDAQGTIIPNVYDVNWKFPQLGLGMGVLPKSLLLLPSWMARPSSPPVRFYLPCMRRAPKLRTCQALRKSSTSLKKNPHPDVRFSRAAVGIWQ
ncbi:hypothetical protein FB451DRAFT_130259 [Mycena latifolia]|nr:hypothetical protein FB451DRAFT_130259 [Mycena latifolia]